MSSDPGKPRKVIPINPEPASPANEYVSMFESEKKVYSRSISGLFSRWRWIMVFLTQLFFYGMPWLNWGERQMLLFDLEARRFYLFGLVLYPQDFIDLTGLLIISALALFLFTAVAGRLWCGFSCPQKSAGTPSSSKGLKFHTSLPAPAAWERAAITSKSPRFLQRNIDSTPSR